MMYLGEIKWEFTLDNLYNIYRTIFNYRNIDLQFNKLDKSFNCFICNQDRLFGVRKVCVSCLLEDFVSVFEISEFSKNQYNHVIYCDKNYDFRYDGTNSIHGNYLSGSPIGSCPKCNHYFENLCVIKDCNNNKKLSKNGSQTKICEYHFNNIESTFEDKNLYFTKKIFIKECGHHGLYSGLSANTKCPKCMHDLKLKNRPKCYVCKKNYVSISCVCDECFESVPNNFTNYMDRGYFKSHKIFPSSCNHHGVYLSSGSKSLCPICLENSNKSNSVKLHEELEKDYSHKIVKINGQDVIMIDFKIGDGFIEEKIIPCKRCNRPFETNKNKSTKFCGHCHNSYTCKICGFRFITNKNLPGSNICSNSCNAKNKWNKGQMRTPMQLGFKNTTEYISNYQLTNNIESKVFEPSKFTKMENPESFDGISGIWLKYDAKNKSVIDICLTKDVGNELRYHFLAINNPIREKYRKMHKIKDNLEFYYLESFNNWENALIRELEIALEYDAVLWHPAPGIQIKIIKELKSRK